MVEPQKPNNSANRLITWAGKPILHGHAPQVWKCVCSPDYLFILFDSGWCSSLGLPFFLSGKRRWHYALCLRYQRFAASRCLVLARLGSFTKHEMDKATVMYCWEWRGGGEKRKEREKGRGEGKGGGGGGEGNGRRRNWKMKRCNGVPLFRGEMCRCCCLRKQLSFPGQREHGGLGRASLWALKYHWRGLIGTVCLCNLCLLDTAD